MTAETRADRQRERVKSIRLHEDVLERVKRYAAENSMSVSEAVREAVAFYRKKEVNPLRKRRQRKVTIWMEPEEYVEFVRQVNADNTTIGAAIEAAFEEIL